MSFYEYKERISEGDTVIIFLVSAIFVHFYFNVSMFCTFECLIDYIFAIVSLSGILPTLFSLFFSAYF